MIFHMMLRQKVSETCRVKLNGLHCHQARGSDESQNRGGIGWIMRDSSGSTICRGLRIINGKWSIKMLEMRAILEGLRCFLALRASRSNLSIPPIIVVSDAIGVINLLNNEDADQTKISFLVGEIERMKFECEAISFSHCP